MQDREKMSRDSGFRMSNQKALIDESSKYKYVEKKGIEKRKSN